MKIKTFLKLTIAAIAVLITISLTSCEKKSACEKNNTGSVKIYNSCGIMITVDVWSDGLGGDGFAGERNIGIGGTTTYDNIPVGYIEIWETDIYYDWGSWAENCYQCETFEFEIYKKKKSELIIISNNGTLLNVDEKLKGDKKQ